MTEAEKAICKTYLEDLDKTHSCNEYKLLMGLLEQQPSDDAISRQAVLEPYRILDDSDTICIRVLRKNVEQLPSVTPQYTDDEIQKMQEMEQAEIQKAYELGKPKTGHWIRVTDNAGHLVWECDKCSWQQRYNTNFCPDCGCRMSEVNE